ncbi:MAG: RagB/SusD family nutrient uptake outer membrane protein [Bacteroidales bacterium]|jgi:hypothetical protein|nr:RagB/SusD family nutrient uptake outer membrane protein [Bacteroidales bacterium]
MKRIYYIFFVLLCCSCDSYLDIVPDNIATIDYAFRDRAGAESYLTTCYTWLPVIGDPRYDPAIMGGDDTWSLYDSWANSKTGNFAGFFLKQQQNSNTPYFNFWEGSVQGKALFQGIRDCNIFLENIHKVGPDLNEDDRNRWVAEVKFLKAYYHYYLLRAYGPIPLIKESLPVDAGIDETKVYRDKFDDCVDYIVQLINEAVPYLPLIIFDTSNEMRRITQPIALSIKAEILVTAASPLFNNNPDYAGFQDNRGEKLFESSLTEKQKWERAKDACKNAIDTVRLAQQFKLYTFNQSVFYSSYSGISDTSKLLMTLRTVVTEKWNSETIWGTLNDLTSCTLPHFLVSHTTLAATEPVIAPTMRMVELFYSNNGVPIDEDINYDYENRFKTDVAPVSHKYYIYRDTTSGYPTAKINMNREPRFYANLGFDGGYWLGNGRKVDFDQSPEDQRAWVTYMLKGKPSGNYMGLRYSITGYLVKKGSHIETQVNSAGTSLNTVQSTFPIMRLADLYLLYAEALNESLDVPSQEVYDYVDSIRYRAGLQGVVDSWRQYSKYSEKPNSKTGMREIIQKERMIELAFEGKRFWDLRRWLLAETEMNRAVRAWNIMGTVPEDYYNLITLYNLQFSKKEYLWPIRHGELLKNTNLVQNPGW